MRPPKFNDFPGKSEMKAEAREIEIKFLLNDSVSPAEANAVIHDFNSRWLTAGGSYGETIINKK